MKKAITTSKEIAALRLDEGRNVQRVRVHTPMGHGLFIEVRKGRNQKVWLYRFSIANKSADYRMGEYPAISLKKALQPALRQPKSRHARLRPKTVIYRLKSSKSCYKS